MIKRNSLLMIFLLSVGTGELYGAQPGRSASDLNKIQALRNVRIVTINREGNLVIIPRGTVLIQGTEIQAVGESLAVPAGAESIDFNGCWLTPGFIDGHYIPGILEGDTNEVTDAITPEFDSLDAFDPWNPELSRYHKLGVTSLALSPGNRNVIGGKISVIKIEPGKYPLLPMKSVQVCKASLASDVLNIRQSRYPTSFSGAISLLEKWLKERIGRLEIASESLDAVPAKAISSVADNEPADGLDALSSENANPDKVVVKMSSYSDNSDSLSFERVLIHLETRTQLERVLPLFEESTLIPIPINLQNMSREAWKSVSGSAAVVVGPYGMDDPVQHLRGAAELERLKVPVVFASSGGRHDLLTTAFLAMHNGLSFEGALAALTNNAATIYGLQRRVGRVEPGLDADLVVWSGNPFSMTACVRGVWVNGQRLYQQEDTQKTKSTKIITSEAKQESEKEETSP